MSSSPFLPSYSSVVFCVSSKVDTKKKKAVVTRLEELGAKSSYMVTSKVTHYVCPREEVELESSNFKRAQSYNAYVVEPEPILRQQQHQPPNLLPGVHPDPSSSSEQEHPAPKKQKCVGNTSAAPSNEAPASALDVVIPQRTVTRSTFALEMDERRRVIREEMSAQRQKAKDAINLSRLKAGAATASSSSSSSSAWGHGSETFAQMTRRHAEEKQREAAKRESEDRKREAGRRRMDTRKKRREMATAKERKKGEVERRRLQHIQGQKEAREEIIVVSCAEGGGGEGVADVDATPRKRGEKGRKLMIANIEFSDLCGRRDGPSPKERNGGLEVGGKKRRVAEDDEEEEEEEEEGEIDWSSVPTDRKWGDMSDDDDDDDDDDNDNIDRKGRGAAGRRRGSGNGRGKGRGKGRGDGMIGSGKGRAPAFRDATSPLTSSCASSSSSVSWTLLPESSSELPSQSPSPSPSPSFRAGGDVAMADTVVGEDDPSSSRSPRRRSSPAEDMNVDDDGHGGVAHGDSDDEEEEEEEDDDATFRRLSGERFASMEEMMGMFGPVESVRTYPAKRFLFVVFERKIDAALAFESMKAHDGRKRLCKEARERLKEAGKRSWIAPLPTFYCRWPKR